MYIVIIGLSHVLRLLAVRYEFNMFNLKIIIIFTIIYHMSNNYSTYTDSVTYT